VTKAIVTRATRSPRVALLSFHVWEASPVGTHRSHCVT